MRRFLVIILACVLALNCFCGCAAKQEPQENQIKSICELATIKCYYNNVAKGTKAKGTGWAHILEKDRKFWIEYEGFATIGIDMNQVTMTVTDEAVSIKMPKAKILDIGIVSKTFTEDSYVISDDGFWNKNKITVEEQQKAVKEAQTKMKKSIEDNGALFEQAEEEAKEIIAGYINKIGEVNGKEYQISWEML